MERSFHITINGTQVPVTEEIYRAYMRPVWAERKRVEREFRCRDESGNRCVEDCDECAKQCSGSRLSLDHLCEEGFDVVDQVDIAEIVAERQLLEQLCIALADLEPDERTLVDALFYKACTEREYAAAIGVTQQVVNKRKHKVIEKIRGALEADKEL